MKWPALILAGFATTASARSDTDYPHRDWGQVVGIDMSVADATACIARGLDRKGRVLIVPVPAGSDIDFHPNAGFTTSSQPWETFRLRSERDSVTLRVLYRRPSTEKTVEKRLRFLKGLCLKAKTQG